MKLAFCLFRYFPFGGVQRNFLRIAELCVQRGHEVHLFALRWDGPPPNFDLAVHTVPTTRWQNIRRYEEFADQVRMRIAREDFDLVVGFNKMPGLDLYYAGDPCFAEAARKRSALYRLSPRYHHFLRFERAVFERDAETRILLIAENQKRHFQEWHGTADERFFLLPPYVSPDRVSGPPREEARERVHREIGFAENDHLLLMIGSDYRRKGVARSIRALAALPEHLRNQSHLLVVGNGRAWPYRLLARRLRVADRVHLLRGRADVPIFLAAADLLLHPALEENTGTAIVEAIAAGLPVLTTVNCGYACHVERSGAGVVLDSPFGQGRMDSALLEMLQSPDRGPWREAARQYALRTDLFSRPQRAVEVIESLGCSSTGTSTANVTPDFAVSSQPS